jgi:hypothetical protein
MADKVQIELEVEAKKAIAAVEKFSVDAQKKLDSLSTNTFIIAIAESFAVAKEVAAPLFDLLKEGFSKATEEALQAQKATIGLANAMRVSGDFSADAVRSFEELGSAIQRSTTFTDDSVLSAAALAKAYGLSNAEARNVVKVSADLAARLGIDLGSATEKLSKTFTGFIDRDLGRMVPALKALSQDALLSGAALGVLQNKVEGSAEVLANSFGGALQQLKNNFNEVFEQFGTAVIKTPEFTKAIKELGTQLGNLAVFVASVAPQIATLTAGLIRFGLGFVVVGAQVERIGLKIKASFEAFVDAAINAVGGLVEAIPAFFKFLVTDVDAGVKQFEKIFSRLNPANFFKAGADAGAKVDAVFNPIIDAAKKVRDSIDKARGSVEAFDSALEKDNGEAARRRKQDAANTKALNDFNAIRAELEKAGLSDVEKINLDAAKQIKLIKAAALAGDQFAAVNQAKLIAAVQLDQAKKLQADLIKVRSEGEAAEQALEKKRREFVEKASKDPIKETINLALGASADTKGAIAIGTGFVSQILKGAAGAQKAVSSLIGGVADLLLPGIGGVVSEIVDVLGQGPEKVREMITGFAKAIPQIIDNIIKALPVLFETLAKELPPALAKAVPFMAQRFVIEMVRNMPAIIKGFVDGLIEGAKAFVQTVIDTFKSLGGLLKGGNGGAIGSSGFLKGDLTIGRAIADAMTLGLNEVFGNPLGLATGGRIPDLPQFSNDRFPAKLSAGEQVLSRDLSSKLDSFLAGQGSGAPQVVQISIGQRELARVLLDLNRNGFRTA